MNKKKFVFVFGEVLKIALPNEIEKVALADENTVEIIFTNGYTRKINIECDSKLGIISDITRKLC